MARSKWKPFLKPLAGLAMAGAVVAGLWWIHPWLGLMATLMAGTLVYAGIVGMDVSPHPEPHSTGNGVCPWCDLSVCMGLGDCIDNIDKSPSDDD